LLPRSRGRYECIDPAANTRGLVTAEVAAGINIEAHQFYRPFPDQPIKGHHLVAFGLRSCVRDLVYVTLAGICGGLLTLLVPVLTGTIFDTVIPRSEYHTLYLYAALIFVSSIAIALFQLVRSFGMLRIETRLDFTLQSAVWDRLLNLPVPFFRKYQAGELAASANSIMMLRKILSDTVIYSLLGAIFMSFNIVLLFIYDAMLAVYIGMIMVFSLLCVLYISRSIMKRQRSIITLQNRIFGMLTQFLSSISKIRIAGAEVHAFSRWAGLFSENKSHTYEVRRSFLSITLLTTSLPMLATLLLFAVIGGRLPGTMSTGGFMAFYTAMTMTVMSYMQLLMAAVSAAFAAPIFDSIRPILDTLPENVAFKAELQRTFGEIEVSNVSFRYHEDGPLVLDNISLHIEPGEFVAVVGPSGSGKSTLLRLLLGFDTPGSGAVYYDRQDLASFDPASLRRQAGTVLQHAQLQPGTIFTNIVGMTAGTHEDAWAAARLVGLDEDILQMPMGMHTVVSGGLSTLSGGQRQRIMIARAIVSRPRILFFDEATSALDNATQQIVSSSLEQLQATRVVIAHRLSTVRNADRIFVLDHGRIVEEGNYDTLMMRNGIFTGLVRRQMVDV
jgi:ATP-binding cassette subfamily C protein